MNWYYAERGRQAGPVGQTELDELVRSGALPSSALVWTEGMVDWKPYSTISTTQAPALANGLAEFQFRQPAGQCICCGRATVAGESTTVGKNTVCFDCKPVFLERWREGDLRTLPGNLPYAGFWIRFVARIADSTVLSLLQTAVIATFFSWMLRPKTQFDWGAMAAYGYSLLAGMALNFSYEVFFLTKRGATPGKMLCYLRVVRADGSPVGVWVAIGRYFSEIIEGFTLGIGYLMAAFDSEKRALHDRIVGTRVVDSPPVTVEEKRLHPVSREIRCAHCQTDIPAADWNSAVPIPCPSCGTAVQAIVFPALARTIAHPAPEARSGEGDAGCYYHENNRATVSCQECGRFLCPVCDLDAGPRHMCPICLNNHLLSGRTPEFVERRTLYDSIALTAAIVPILTIYFSIFTAPAVVGFIIWSWNKPGAITPRTKWRFMLALLIALGNILLIGAIFIILVAGALSVRR